MFDFAWSEIGLIAAVALIMIGPKDMPVAIRTITDMIKKARRMAGEFQTHVDEMMRDADLGEVRDQIKAIRNFDIRGAVERHIDPDRSIRDTFSGNPLEPAPAADVLTTPAPMDKAVDEAAVAELDPIVLEAPASDVPEQSTEDPAPPPAFIPPAFVSPTANGAADTEAPAFIPPQAVRHGSRPAA